MRAFRCDQCGNYFDLTEFHQLALDAPTYSVQMDLCSGCADARGQELIAINQAWQDAEREAEMNSVEPLNEDQETPSDDEETPIDSEEEPV